MAEAQKKAIGGLKAFWILLRKSWALFKRSKLGLAGTTIIAVFVFMAIFAPFVAPYTPEFLAPDQDVFVAVSYGKTYDVEGNFLEPVVGPASPNHPYPPGGGGRLWLIVARDTGLIEMNNITRGETPFADPSPTISLRIQDFGFSTPISNIHYIVPGKRLFGQTQDDITRNGLLAFVANHEMVVMDPFTRHIWLRQDLGFQPKWFVQDPVSAGEMYDFPQELNSHTYRFFVAANESRLVVYRIDYRSNYDSPVIPPGGAIRLLSVDMPVTGMPLAYYLQLQGSKSGVFVPTSGNNLRVFSVLNVSRQANISLELGGEPANVSAPIGYLRAVENQTVYVPLKSASKTGIASYFPRDILNRNLTLLNTLTIDDPTAVVTTQPDSANANLVPHFAVTYYQNGNATSTRILRGSESGRLDPLVDARLPHPLRGFVYSTTNSEIMALDTAGTVWFVSTVSASVLRRSVVNFSGDSNPDRRYLIFAGSPGGAKYSVFLSSEEMLALTFEPKTGTLVLFKLLGMSIAPLPPGRYPSGNTYYLGTDNQGHDILTQLIYGSRVALEVGVLAAFFAVVIGTLVGLVAGFYGGLLDTLLMRLTDIALVLPFLPLVLILAAILGPSIVNIIIVLAVLGWPGIARVIRAQTLSLKERPFVDAARISGASRSRTMLVHIAPNVLPFAFLYMTLLVGGAILTEAAVSFLGLGDPKPSNVSWGAMLQTLSSSGNTLTAWWWLLPPGLCITLLSLGFYLVGRAIDEIINPRLRER